MRTFAHEHVDLGRKSQFRLISFTELYPPPEYACSRRDSLRCFEEALMSSLRTSQEAGLIADDYVGSGPDYQQYSGDAPVPPPPNGSPPGSQENKLVSITNGLVDLGTLVCLIIAYGITVALGAAEPHWLSRDQNELRVLPLIVCPSTSSQITRSKLKINRLPSR